MLTLRVTSHDGAVPARPIEARFDTAGGTIGRADDNRLVLPDPTRRISRVHARVAFAGDGFDLVVEGANAIDVNGAPAGAGQKLRLRHGDQLRIGAYHVGVVLDAPNASAPAAADPFAALGSPSPLDPLGLGSARAAVPQTVPDARRRSPSGGIPDDFDPFAAPTAPAHRVAASPLPDDLDLGLGGPAGAAPSIDALFGLAPAAAGDPFAEGPLSQPSAPARGQAPATLDPLVALGAPPAPVPAAPVPDRVPEVHGTFKLPQARAQRAAPPAAPAQADTFLSWENGAAAATAADPLARAEPARAGAAPAHLTRIEPAAQPSPAAPSPPPAVVPPPPAAPVEAVAARADAAATDALTRAFLAGLGIERPPLAALSPEAMELIGRLLREATQGTLDLLMARAMTKREVRAEATMIVGKDNNPLKFSPGVDAALAHLLQPQGRGFMPPVEAMRDAYDDLRSHQFGFMAGLRAALAGVLKRFDPAVLEQRLAARSVLDSVLPMNRRAKLWELYEQLYREIAAEAEDDFHTLFGREFLRAYEEQVARLDASPSAPAPAPKPRP